MVTFPMADIVDDFLQRLARLGVDQHQATEVERDLRQQWGGGEVYVGKRLNPATRQRIIENGLRQQRQLGTIIGAKGFSRSTVYRVLKSKA
jgi:hypothetical protein